MAKPPNLLFIFTDQHRYDVMGSCATPQVSTPNLDTFASQATVFEQAYCTQPVCIPSRGSLMTGLWPHTHTATSNASSLPIHMPCLPELIDDDRATGYFGKWDLGEEIFAQHGFDHWISTEDCYAKRYARHRDADRRSDYHQFLTSQGCTPADGSRFTRYETSALPEPLSKPAFLAQEVTQWLEANRDRPFVGYVNFLEPHTPNFGPRDKSHNPADVPLPDNFNAPPGPDQHPWPSIIAARYYQDGIILDHDGSATPLRTDEDWQRTIAQYWGLVELVDTYMGQILSAVRDMGLWDDTIIVYTSDHGEMLGSHRMMNKSVMFEESTRVPMMIKPAQSSGGHVVRGPFSHIDLMPTLFDLMSAPMPQHLPGVSRAAAARGEVGQLTDDVFVQWHGGAYDIWRAGQPDAPPNSYPDYLADIMPVEKAVAAFSDTWRMIVTADGWKFNFSPNGWHELYDLNNDSQETHNLASDAQQAGRVDTLKRRVIAWMETVQDPMRYKFSA